MQLVIPPPKYHVRAPGAGCAQRADRGARRGIFVIKRGGTGEELVTPHESLTMLLANCDDAFGFPPYSSLERLLLAVADDDLRAAERAIIAEALDGVPSRAAAQRHARLGDTDPRSRRLVATG